MKNKNIVRQAAYISVLSLFGVIANAEQLLPEKLKIAAEYKCTMAWFPTYQYYGFLECNVSNDAEVKVGNEVNVSCYLPTTAIRESCKCTIQEDSATCKMVKSK